MIDMRKSERYEERFYRDWHSTGEALRFQVCIMETDLDIIMDSVDEPETLQGAVIGMVEEIRQDIIQFANLVPEFLTSLEPLLLSKVELGILLKKAYIKHGLVLESMIRGSRICDVGPMASVAGVTAEYVVKQLVETYGPINVIVENGGDICLHTNEVRKVAIYAGDSVLSNKLAIQLDGETGFMSVCTSSGTMGHSLSFGKGDAVVVLSKEAAVADAAATYLCNQLKSPDDIQKVLDIGKDLPEVLGIVMIMKDKLGIWGQIDIVKL